MTRFAEFERWRADEFARITAWRGATPRLTWAEIGARLGRSPNSCHVKWRRHCEARRAAGENLPLQEQRLWSADDVARLIRLREQDGLTWAEIDQALGRRSTSAEKYRKLCREASPVSTLTKRRPQVPAVAHRSLTAQLLGDPPPGRSALDKMRAGTAMEMPEPRASLPALEQARSSNA